MPYSFYDNGILCAISIEVSLLWILLMFLDTTLGSRAIYVFTAFFDISYFIKVNEKLQVPVNCKMKIHT